MGRGRLREGLPGTWAEYRVFEGGISPSTGASSAPDALAWSEQTRDMYAGIYAEYALGRLDERCYAIWPRGGDPGPTVATRRHPSRPPVPVGRRIRVMMVAMRGKAVRDRKAGHHCARRRGARPSHFAPLRRQPAGGCSVVGGEDETTATTVPNGVRIVDLEARHLLQALGTPTCARSRRACDG